MDIIRVENAITTVLYSAEVIESGDILDGGNNGDKPYLADGTNSFEAKNADKRTRVAQKLKISTKGRQVRDVLMSSFDFQLCIL